MESAGGTWREAAAMAEADLAALVRSDGVQVLVELTGHTAHNRLGVMAMRPAPVQACPPPVPLATTQMKCRHANSFKARGK